MALAAAAAFEGRRAGWLVGAVVVDHGLQPGSSEVAAGVARLLTTHAAFHGGVDPVRAVRVDVGSTGGPEAAAREARRAALLAVAAETGAVVLMGHTRDDQAETVLLGLARGSGLRSLSGIAPVSGPIRRPLLTVSRAETARVCSVLSIPVWDDPHNDDDRFARVRVRREVLPLLEDRLGPGVAEALARTADLARADADLLDGLAVELAASAGLARPGAAVAHRGALVDLDVGVLSAAPQALRHRALRLGAIAAGCPPTDLSALHVLAVDALVTGWHGQAGVDLPGRVTVRRADGRLLFAAAAH